MRPGIGDGDGAINCAHEGVRHLRGGGIGSSDHPAGVDAGNHQVKGDGRNIKSCDSAIGCAHVAMEPSAISVGSRNRPLVVDAVSVECYFCAPGTSNVVKVPLAARTKACSFPSESR